MSISNEYLQLKNEILIHTVNIASSHRKVQELKQDQRKLLYDIFDGVFETKVTLEQLDRLKSLNQVLIQLDQENPSLKRTSNIFKKISRIYNNRIKGRLRSNKLNHFLKNQLKKPEFQPQTPKPAAYLSFIRTALHAVSDQSVAINNACEEGFHELYSRYRRNIAEQMGAIFGRKETHTLNSILILIGEERQIPGYQLIIEDKQMDIRDSEHSNVLRHFDQQNSPELLVSWFDKKIHGEIDGKWALFPEIQEHLAIYFNADLGDIRDVIIQINERDELRLKKEAIIACLEIFKIIIPFDESQSAIAYIKNQLK